MIPPISKISKEKYITMSNVNYLMAIEKMMGLCYTNEYYLRGEGEYNVTI